MIVVAAKRIQQTEPRGRALGLVHGSICATSLLCLVGCVTQIANRQSPIAENFAVVVAATNGAAGIYCSGTPTARGWEVLRGMGVMKSVNLDTVADPVVNGIVSRQFAIDDWQQTFGTVGPQLEAALLEIGPGAVVHCRHGANRSRTLIILYRMRVLGWSKARAIAEAEQFGWGNSLPALKKYVEDQPEAGAIPEAKSAHLVPPPVPPLPPLPDTGVSEEESMPGVEIVSPPRQSRVTLAWENPPAPSAAEDWVTGLEATVDFTNWTEVARIPYELRYSVTLTNRPSTEFYRAFNAHR